MGHSTARANSAITALFSIMALKFIAVGNVVGNNNEKSTISATASIGRPYTGSSLRTFLPGESFARSARVGSSASDFKDCKLYLPVEFRLTDRSGYQAVVMDADLSKAPELIASSANSQTICPRLKTSARRHSDATSTKSVEIRIIARPSARASRSRR